jgi:hypothetical protein
MMDTTAHVSFEEEARVVSYRAEFESPHLEEVMHSMRV